MKRYTVDDLIAGFMAIHIPGAFTDEEKEMIRIGYEAMTDKDIKRSLRNDPQFAAAVHEAWTIRQRLN